MKANEQLVVEMLRAVEERDGKRLMEILAPEVEFVWPPALPRYGGTYKGQEVVAMMQEFDAVWDPLQPTAEHRKLHARIVASNEYEVVVSYIQQGVDNASNDCSSEVLALYTVEGGYITRLKMFYLRPEAVATAVTGPTELPRK